MTQRGKKKKERGKTARVHVKHQLNSAPDALRNVSVAGSNNVSEVGRVVFAAFLAAATPVADAATDAAPDPDKRFGGRGGATTLLGGDAAFRVLISSAGLAAVNVAVAVEVVAAEALAVVEVPLFGPVFAAGFFFVFLFPRAIVFGLPLPPFLRLTFCSVYRCRDFVETRLVCTAGDETALSRMDDVIAGFAPFLRLTFVSSCWILLLLLFEARFLDFGFPAPPRYATAAAAGTATDTASTAVAVAIAARPMQLEERRA